MIASTQHQSLLFFTPLAQQVALLKDDLLDPVDHLLDDDQLIDLVASPRIASCAVACSNTSRDGASAISSANCAAICCIDALPTTTPIPPPTSRSSAAPLPCSVPTSPSRCCAGSSASPVNRAPPEESAFESTALSIWRHCATPRYLSENRASCSSSWWFCGTRTRFLIFIAC